MRPAAGVTLALAAALIGASAPVSAAALTLERRIPLGEAKGRIDHLAVDLDGRRLFVAELGNDSVGVIDLQAGKLVAQIDGLAEPQGVGWEPRTGTLWVANARDGSVRIFDGATLKMLDRIDLGDDADNVRISGGQVFVGYGSGAIAAIDASSRKRTSTLRLHAHPEGFQLDPASASAFVNVPEEREIDVVDLSSGLSPARWPTAQYRANFPMAVNAQADEVAVVARHPVVLLIYGRSGNLKWNSPTCGDADDVFFDPHRRRIYVSCGDGMVAIHADQRDGPTETIQSAPGARTSLFSPELDRLFVAAPAHSGPAEIIVLKPTAE
jgi:YVTN family beta-propeller protein